ncbi:B-box zinc finger protein 21 [Aegilops tauschii subsp. strangulata]|uniref:B box-type domain-containing protein n=1 Tax=Aegilops tauschii subsp. strangulata TaxID=200361 RepID=A0A453P6E3_AEGTS|nr:B-box zinc finger protein 20 [Aegilops tauschii subsp. strangulata]
MKVQCDVCAADAASVFCCADEAALCDACDRRVHRANKLAGKHRRFSLLNPSPSSASPSQMPPPLCDICQEKRGFLFCKEDRAILCRECDVSVHTASELSMRHARFLLTGVRVSSEPAASPAPPPSEEENTSSHCCSGDDDAHGASSGSSISEYLTKTLPGWHVEDFLVDDATAAAAAAAASAGFSSGGSYQGVGTPNFALHDAGYPAGWTRQEHWVPQMYAELAGGKRSRTSAANSHW